MSSPRSTGEVSSGSVIRGARDRVQPIRNVGLLALPGCIFAHLTGERVGQSGGYARHLEAGFQRRHVDAAVSCHLLAL